MCLVIFLFDFFLQTANRKVGSLSDCIFTVCFVCEHWPWIAPESSKQFQVFHSLPRMDVSASAWWGRASPPIPFTPPPAGSRGWMTESRRSLGAERLGNIWMLFNISCVVPIWMEQWQKVFKSQCSYCLKVFKMNIVSFLQTLFKLPLHFSINKCFCS